nr:hypothetical protein [Bacteroidota bacterium]
MLRILHSLLFFFSAASLYGQTHNIWTFGYYQGLDFTVEPPAQFRSAQISWVGTCGSISDSAGRLLFYTNGRHAWNRNHELMQNGTLINRFGEPTQGMVILPVPGQYRQYRIFMAGQYDDRDDLGLASYLVDMTANDGLGAVVGGPYRHYDSVYCDKLTTVRHANN